MPRALVALAEGFEEIEAVTIVDVLRRAGVEVHVAGLKAGAVAGSHGISIVTDMGLEQVQAGDYDALALPGGMPGAANLRSDSRVLDIARAIAARGGLVAAICAAPMALAAAGLLEGRKATSYPSFRDELRGAIYCEDRVVEDGLVVTSRGPGTALEFALTLVRRLVGEEKAAALASAMLAAGSPPPAP